MDHSHHMMTDLRARRLKSRTMRRVYGMWLVRRVLPILVLEIATIVFIVSAVQGYMSFGGVFANMTERATDHSFISFMRYLSDILVNTDHMIKLFIVGAAASSWLIARDMANIMRHMRGNFLGASRVI